MRRAPPNAKKGKNNLKSYWRASSSQRVLFCKERTIQLLWGQENKIKNEVISNWDNKPVVCAVSVKLIPSPALANRERKITWTDHRRTQPTAVDPEWWAPSNTVETENLTNFYGLPIENRTAKSCRLGVESSLILQRALFHCTNAI